MFADLDRSVRGRLRTLSKDNADGVGRHLVMVGRLLDTDPELAYEHAQAAVRRAGRVDVVREAAGLAAYRTERYAEALRELRTVRRLNGSSEHLAIMADCERGLGRPERALALAQEPEASTLDSDAQIELAIVVSGARLDLGQPEAALAALSTDAVRAGSGIVAIRVAQARSTALEAAGQVDEAAAELAPYTQEQLDEAAGDVEPDEEFVAFDLSEFDDEGDYEDYPVEASGDPGTSELAAAELDDVDDDDDALAEAEALLVDDESEPVGGSDESGPVGGSDDESGPVGGPDEAGSDDGEDVADESESGSAEHVVAADSTSADDSSNGDSEDDR